MIHGNQSAVLLGRGRLAGGPDGDGVRRLVAAVQVEKRQNLLREGVFERVDVGPSFHVVEGHLALLVVHVHAHPPGLGVEGQRRGRRRGHPVPVAFLHGQSPVALSGAHGDPPLPVDRRPGHSQVPVVLVPHLDLPVMSPRGEALSAQDDDHRVEAVRVVGEVLPRPQVSHLVSVLGKLQPRVGAVGVQSHVHCGHRTGKVLDELGGGGAHHCRPVCQSSHSTEAPVWTRIS